MSTDLNRMDEAWIAGIPETPTTLGVKSDVVSARLDQLNAQLDAIQNHVHPDLEVGGHAAARIREDRTHQDVDAFMHEVLEARLGAASLDDLLSLSTVGGETISRIYEGGYPVSPASASTLGFLPVEDTYQPPINFTLELPGADQVDLTKPVKLSFMLNWSDYFGADRTRTPWRAFMAVGGQPVGEITSLFAATPDTVIAAQLPVPGGVLQSGSNTVEVSFQAAPARGHNRIFGNQNNATVRTEPRWITHPMTNSTTASAVRLIVYRAGSAAPVAVTELQVFSNQTLCTGVTATATSSGLSHEASRAVDGNVSDAGSWYSLTAPTYDAPQALMVQLASTQVIDMVRFVSFAGTNDRQPLDYELQVSTDLAANVADPIDSLRWQAVDMQNGFLDGSEAARVTDGTDADIDFRHVSTLLPVLAYPTEMVTVSNLQASVKISDAAILFDAGRPGVYWPKVFWDSMDPDGSSLAFVARAGEDNPPVGSPQELYNGERVLGQGRYLSLTPAMMPGPAGDYPSLRTLNASWMPDPDGNIKADLFSLQVNLVRLNWELRRYKASLQSNLSRLVMDVFRDTTGLDASRSSNWMQVTPPEGFGIGAADTTQSCILVTTPIALPEEAGKTLLLADLDGPATCEISRDDGVTWELSSNGGYNVFAGLPGGSTLRLRFTLAPTTLLHAWAVYY